MKWYPPFVPAKYWQKSSLTCTIVGTIRDRDKHYNGPTLQKLKYHIRWHAFVMIINNAGQKKDKYSSWLHVYPSISLLIHLSIHLIFVWISMEVSDLSLNTSACRASARVQYHKNVENDQILGWEKHPRKTVRGWGQSGEPWQISRERWWGEGGLGAQGRGWKHQRRQQNWRLLTTGQTWRGGEWYRNGRNFLPNFCLEPQLGTGLRCLKYTWGEICRLNFRCNLFCLLPCLLICGILVPDQGWNPRPPNHWTARIPE